MGGEEDGIKASASARLYTTPEETLEVARRFSKVKGARYLLAATFGNVHGVYKPGHVKLKPSILKDCQDAVEKAYGKDARFALVFHGGSGSTLEEIHEAVDYGVVKMNIDTDTQYAFTRAIVSHMMKNYDGVLKVDGEVGNKKAYDPRSYLALAEASMAERVKQAVQDLRGTGTTTCSKGMIKESGAADDLSSSITPIISIYSNTPFFWGGFPMLETDLDFTISRLGECRIPSPVSTDQFVGDHEHMLYHDSFEEIKPFLDAGKEAPRFELAGPRAKIYFDPSKLKCGIVTCGGLCPGLNDVIRAIVLGLSYHYGVKTVFGFRYGYEGLSHRYGHVPIELTPDMVNGIHKMGGSFLASSRGAQDISEMVDTLERMNIGILFTIGGDGTLRGAKAIAEEVGRRGLKIGVIGIPKTIDNDISYIQASFGFETAVSESRTAIDSANAEAMGARNGIGLVKLMGRESGFIAAYAALANNDVNYCLIPEVPFTLEGFLGTLKRETGKPGTCRDCGGRRRRAESVSGDRREGCLREYTFR